MTANRQEPTFRDAALRAQELLAVTRAIEARVSALTSETPGAVVEETAALLVAELATKATS